MGIWQKDRQDDATCWLGRDGCLPGRCLRVGTVLLQPSASVLTDEHRTQTILIGWLLVFNAALSIAWVMIRVQPTGTPNTTQITWIKQINWIKSAGKELKNDWVAYECQCRLLSRPYERRRRFLLLLTFSAIAMRCNTTPRKYNFIVSM